ncbi:Trimeric GatFAB AmidoTransferase(AdT) complex subunit [Entomophthora muscae]|uniref:Trimeric GatFAB AmidoTransferase(AdT) complex subunit n=2 Tax=Entomophthora muscae TaxID=34485 RepID=A0ACC2SPI3_9FUNG|nr:Trimeric GatFAB AmidoTransferase(AdT) complex subunit [Entomophthora muscae]
MMPLKTLRGFNRKLSTSATLRQEITLKELKAWNSIHNAFISLSDVKKFRVGSETPNEPLKGVSIAVKDNICTKDFPTTCASLTLKDYCPDEDATVVRLLREKGAFMMGKTNLDEFGMGSSNAASYFGPTFNPFFPEGKHVPGGSSGGSAAAVAAGMCYGALGTDTGGSVRLPAAYCGVVGFKPSYGRISRFGLVAYASSLDTVGILANDIGRVSCLFEAIEGADPKDQTSRRVIENDTANSSASLSGIKVGIPQEYFMHDLDSHTLKAWRDCIQQLKKTGAELSSVSLPNTKYALPAYYVIALSEASSNLSRYDGVKFGHQSSGCTGFSRFLTQNRDEGFGDEVKRRILLGTYALTSEAIDDYYHQAQKVRRLVKQDFDAAFSHEPAGVDFLLTPTAIGISPKANQKHPTNSAAPYLNDVFTVPASLAGLPAISLPWNPPGTPPVGLQLIAQFDHDNKLLQWADLVARISPAKN